jgi:pyridoxamine 5'-phosphate oxidase
MGPPPPLPASVAARVQELLDRGAAAGDLAEPMAFTLATAGADGRPSSRTMLLKGFDAEGFVFYTNLQGRKARQLAENPWAAVTLFWQSQLKQVQAEGSVERVPDADADAYWATRTRESRIGAWASEQSQVLPSREELERRVREVERRYEGRDVPRPPHWSGFRLRPVRLELWTSREHRLHDRECWIVENGAWESRRLFP